MHMHVHTHICMHSHAHKCTYEHTNTHAQTKFHDNQFNYLSNIMVITSEILEYVILVLLIEGNYEVHH
jgi:hypothetical protein